MLKLFMEVKGRFSSRMVRKHLRNYEKLSLEPHFTSSLSFISREQDPISKSLVIKEMNVDKPTDSLASRLLAKVILLSPNIIMCFFFFCIFINHNTNRKDGRARKAFRYSIFLLFYALDITFLIFACPILFFSLVKR